MKLDEDKNMRLHRMSEKNARENLWKVRERREKTENDLEE